MNRCAIFIRCLMACVSVMIVRPASSKDGVYYHGALRLSIAFPKDWDIRATPTEVFARSGKDAARMSARRTALPSEAQTPQEYLTETLKRDDLEDGEAIQVGAYSGYIASIKVADEKKALRKIAVLSKTVEYMSSMGKSISPVRQSSSPRNSRPW